MIEQVDETVASGTVVMNNRKIATIQEADFDSASIESSTLLPQLLAHYEETMTNYIYAIPHIPPTLFELKLRHADIKKATIARFDTILAQRRQSSPQPQLSNVEPLRQRLNEQIDQLFTKVLVLKNTLEYKKCQAGFIIGWKCNANKPNNLDGQNRIVDDRF